MGTFLIAPQIDLETKSHLHGGFLLLPKSLFGLFDFSAALGVIKDALADAQALWGDFEQLVVRQILDS